MAKVVYLLPPTPVLAHQRNRPHGGRRRPLHRQVQKKLLIAIKQKDFHSQPQFLLPTKNVSITILTKKTHTKKQY